VDLKGFITGHRIRRVVVGLTLASLIVAGAGHAQEAGASTASPDRLPGPLAAFEGTRPLQLVERLFDPVATVVRKVAEGPVQVALLRVSQGVLVVSREMLRGFDRLEAGGRVVPVVTREGVLWLEESMVRTGQLLQDEQIIEQGVEAFLDGARFLAVALEEGIIFLPIQVARRAQQLGKLVWRGVRWVAGKIGTGLVFFRDDPEGAARRVRRRLIASEIRTALAGNLGVGIGNGVVDSLLRRRQKDRDPWIRQLAADALELRLGFARTFSVSVSSEVP
jgi:hypothetical protein